MDRLRKLTPEELRVEADALRERLAAADRVDADLFAKQMAEFDPVVGMGHDQANADEAEIWQDQEITFDLEELLVAAGPLDVPTISGKRLESKLRLARGSEIECKRTRAGYRLWLNSKTTATLRLIFQCGGTERHSVELIDDDAVIVKARQIEGCDKLIIARIR